jgi:condensation domain-containing protein
MNISVNPMASAPPLSLGERGLVEAWLRAQSPLDEDSNSTIPTRANPRWAPATHGQEQIWFHSKLAGTQLIYNEPVTVHYHGSLNVDALRKSIAAFVQRHEAWRTTFVFQDGALRQNIHPRMEPVIPLSDLSALSERKRDRRATDIARRDALLPFDLSSGPLLRCRLVRMTPVLHRLYICLHHIIFDGVSLYDIFLPELLASYRAFASAAEPQLAPPPIQYGDYAEWQKQRIASDEVASQAKYWKTSLREMRDLELPIDRPRTKYQSFRGSMEQFFVPKATANALREVGYRANSTLFMVLTAVLAAQLKFWTGTDDIPIGSATSGRKWSETEGVVGFFLNTLVLRINGSNDPSFTQLVERVRETVIGAMERDELPFPTVVQELQAARRDASRHPLFQIMFSLEPPLSELAPGWAFTQMDVETSVTKFDLHLEMDERSDGILARFIYNVDLFKRQTVRRMAKEWLRIAREAAASPDAPLSQLIPYGTGQLRRRFWSFLRHRTSYAAGSDRSGLKNSSGGGYDRVSS